MKINKPNAGEYADYAIKYINLVPDDGFLLRHLADNMKSTIEFVLSLPAAKLDYVYAPGKWTIKEIFVHISDAERIFAYRALCIARGEQTDLPGFEENDYAANSLAEKREGKEILREFAAVRNATLALFAGFDETVFAKTGTVNHTPTSVRAIAYGIAGHELHHLNVIKERYL